MHSFKAPVGKYVFDPVFVLASVLDWAGIARNERGYLTLTGMLSFLLLVMVLTVCKLFSRN